MQTLRNVSSEGSESYPPKIISPDGCFLNDSIPFNYRLNTPLLNGYIESLFSQIYLSNIIYKSEEKKTALNTTISNILTAHYNSKCLSVSKNRNTYSIANMYGMEHYSYTNIIPFIEWLIKTDRLNKANGYYDVEKKLGRNTRVWATQKFINEIEGFIWSEQSNCSIENLSHQMKYNIPIILKDKYKQPCNFRPNEVTKPMKKFLDEYNPFMKAQDITIPFEVNMELGVQNKSRFYISNFLRSIFITSSHSYIPDTSYNIHIPYNINIQSYGITTTPLLRYNDTNYLLYKGLNTELYRVFNQSFKFGGRFYGGDYQGFPKEIRNQMLINGERVVELDYSGYHFMMLYHLSGINYKSDPYLAVYDIPELRPLLKLLCSILINAGSKRKAVSGFNEEVYFRDPKRNSSKRKYHKEMIEKYNLSFEELYNLFVNKHKPLEKHFLSGVGLNLQYIDSRIAENVMRHFLKIKVPCMCIHDSFIVPENYRSELEEVMREQYRGVMNSNFDIKIK